MFPERSEDFAAAVRDALNRITVESIDAGDTTRGREEIPADPLPTFLQVEGPLVGGVHPTTLAAFGYIVSNSLASLDREVLARLTSQSLSTLRARLAETCRRRHVALFESTWHWLEAEDDRHVLHAVLLLVATSSTDAVLADDRRRVLATRAATHRVVELSQDSEFLEQVDAWRREVEGGER